MRRAGDLVDAGASFVLRVCVATIKCFVMAIGSPPQGLTMASFRIVNVYGSKVRKAVIQECLVYAMMAEATAQGDALHPHSVFLSG